MNQPGGDKFPPLSLFSIEKNIQTNFTLLSDRSLWMFQIMEWDYSFRRNSTGPFLSQGLQGKRGGEEGKNFLAQFLSMGPGKKKEEGCEVADVCVEGVVGRESLGGRNIKKVGKVHFEPVISLVTQG